MSSAYPQSPKSRAAAKRNWSKRMLAANIVTTINLKKTLLDLATELLHEGKVAENGVVNSLPSEIYREYHKLQEAVAILQDVEAGWDDTNKALGFKPPRRPTKLLPKE